MEQNSCHAHAVVLLGKGLLLSFLLGRFWCYLMVGGGGGGWVEEFVSIIVHPIFCFPFLLWFFDYLLQVWILVNGLANWRFDSQLYELIITKFLSNNILLAWENAGILRII